MTSAAAFGFYWFMLEGEKPGLIGVALEADLVLRGGRPQEVGLGTAVLVVAIRAADESLFHAMPEGTREILLGVGMTSETELRLFFDEQKLRLFCLMGRVTGNAAYIVDVVL